VPIAIVARSGGSVLRIANGLQDVTAIPLPTGATEDQILKVCRERCRSDHFVLIDECREIKDTFMLGAAMSAEGNMDSINGYRIFKKQRV
jgi:hypothetical protein